MLGDGKGAFSAMETFKIPETLEPHAVAVGDLDDDGSPDLVLASTLDGSSDIGVLLGDGHAARSSSSG
jgi:hypothetical protein